VQLLQKTNKIKIEARVIHRFIDRYGKRVLDCTNGYNTSWILHHHNMSNPTPLVVTHCTCQARYC